MNTMTYESHAVLPVEAYLPKKNTYLQNVRNTKDISKEAHEEQKELRYLNSFMDNSTIDTNLHSTLSLPLKKLNEMREYNRKETAMILLSDGTAESSAFRAAA